MKDSGLFVLLFSISLLVFRSLTLFFKTYPDTLLKTWVENQSLKILLNNNNKKTARTIAQFHKPLKDTNGWVSAADRTVHVHMNENDITLNAVIDSNANLTIYHCDAEGNVEIQSSGNINNNGECSADCFKFDCSSLTNERTLTCRAPSIIRADRFLTTKQ